MGAQIVYQSLCRPPVCQHFQTSLKPLGQLNSNFIWRLLRTRERKFVQCPGHMTKMAATPIYDKNLQNQKADDLGTWYVALGMWDLKLGFLMHLYGKFLISVEAKVIILTSYFKLM